MNPTALPAFFNRYYYDTDIASMGVRLLGCGHYSREMFKLMPDGRTLNCYGLVYLLEGRGSYQSRHVEPRAVKSGDVLLIFPGEWHQYNPLPDADWHEQWFIFEGESVDFLLRKGHLKLSHAVVTLPPGSSLPEVAQDALHKVYSGLRHQLLTLPGQIFSMLSLLAQPPSPRTQEHDAITGLVHDIQEEPLKPWDFYQLAVRLGISYHTLRKKIVLATGMPPQRFVNTVRIERSCRYLLQGMTVQQAASAVGMSDPFYFSRQFRSIIGQSPRAFSMGSAAGTQPRQTHVRA